MTRALRPALLLLALLAACGREAPEAPPQAPAVSFREAGRPIASTTRGGPGDLGGDWVVSQAFPSEPNGLAVPPGTPVTLAVGSHVDWIWDVGDAHFLTSAGVPGRYEPAAEGTPRLWILWVDDDFRTAAVGTPDGSFGWIMDRPGQASADRTEAARRMLEFNGYDLGRLQGAGQ